jgi:hypothetical protein
VQILRQTHIDLIAVPRIRERGKIAADSEALAQRCCIRQLGLLLNASNRETWLALYLAVIQGNAACQHA